MTFFAISCAPGLGRSPRSGRYIFFGSRARGDNRPDSDLDLAFDLDGIQLSELVSNADAWRGELARLTGLRIKDLILSSDPEASERLLIFGREGAG
jgi:predicted nucleotidyltransferase